MIIATFIAIMLIVAAAVFNYLLIPYLIMVLLAFFGITVPLYIIVIIWFLLSLIFS